MVDLVKEIRELKKEKNAVILVHNYQRPEIYEVADFIGDSLELSQKAAQTKADIIVFCGVDFMAESGTILNPDKKVLLPTLEAKCPMAAMVNAQSLSQFKKQYPEAAVVCYINTSAEVKAVSDICCTSANAIKVVNSLPQKKIIFVPDKNLARYVSLYTDKEIIPWDGFCYVHQQFSAKSIKRAKKQHPHAQVIVHPECLPEVIKLADRVCSTSQMLKYAKESQAKEFIICTEIGLILRLRKEIPGKKFWPGSRKICKEMKENSLELVKESLLLERYEIRVPEKIRLKAKETLDKMLKLS